MSFILMLFADRSETLDLVLVPSLVLSQISEAKIKKQLVQTIGFLLIFLVSLSVQHHL